VLDSEERFSASPHTRAGKEARILARLPESANGYSEAGNASEARILAGCCVSRLPLPLTMSAPQTPDSPVTRLWSFIRAILDLVLDLSFKRLVTPKLIRVVYALSLVGAVIYTWRWIDGFLGFVTAPLAFLAYAIVARVIVELILVIFRIAEKIAPLDENAPQEEDVLLKLKK
jgi:hypothetical protein